MRNLDREVGPIKYLAQMIYGSDERDILDQAIRLFILMLVFVFDPLAVMLVIAANQTLLRYGINLESSGPNLPPTPKSDSPPSAVDDAAVAMAESYALKRESDQKKSLEKEIAKLKIELEKKPKEVIVEKEIPVEKIVEVEKVVEVEKDDIDVKIEVPQAIKDLEKRLEKKLNK